MRDFYQQHKWAILILGIALCLILVSSFFASLIQSAGFSVKVTDLRDQTNEGTVEIPYTNITDGVVGEAYVARISGSVASGILFVPKSASATSPRPGIVLTHGYLNSRELQLQNAIELARRGFVVITIDRGGHGNNELTSDSPALYNTTGMYEAAKYLHNLPVCNGQIGISGHSMGGYTTITTLTADNTTFAKAGSRTGANAASFSGNNLGIIDAALIQAFDPYEVAGPNVSVGLLKAKDDEFFFKSTLVDGTPSISRQFLQSKTAASFVRLTNPALIDIKSGDIYVAGANVGQYTNGTKAQNGFRVIYEADEIHPQNHFSVESARYVTNFFYTAFGVPADSEYIAESNQTWWVKELFSTLGLIGFFALAIPVVDLLLSIPFFRGLKKEEHFEEAEIPQLVGVRRHISYWVAAAATTLFSGFSIQWVMSGQGWLNGIAKMLFNQNANFPQDTTGTVAAWAITCAAFAVLATVIVYIVNRVIDYFTFAAEPFGHGFVHAKMTGGLSAVFKTILVAGLTVLSMYVVLFVNWGIWTVDFRIWSFDVKVFEVSNMLPMMVRYMLPFFIFFGINSIFNQTFKAENLPEWATTAINAAFNVAGILLVILIQYITFRSTGVLWQADMALSYIVLFPIIPILIIATIYSRRLYVRTGNAWLGGILNAMLFTIITCANTASSFVSNGFFF